MFVAGTARATPSDPQGFRLLGYDGATGHHPSVARFNDGTADFAAALALSADGTRAFVAGSGDQDC